LLPLIFPQSLPADEISASRLAGPNPVTNPDRPLMLDLAKPGAYPTKIDSPRASA
jgi:hypothetical protein